MSLEVNAQKLKEENIPFAVYLLEDNVHAYVVTRENWAKVESYIDGNVFPLGGSIPLISYNKDLEQTAKEFGWILIGEI